MSTRVSVMLMNVKPPLIVEGTVVQEQADRLVVELPAGTPMPRAGTQVVLDFPEDPQHAREVVSVLEVGNNTITAKVRLKHLDLRDAPRLFAGIALRYRTVGSDGPTVEQWLSGAPEPAHMFQPDPYMNFSMTGLQFEDEANCAPQDTLLFSLQLHRDKRTWRGAAKVVRVAPIPAEEREEGGHATHRIAISFTELPDECRKALVDQTNRIHDSLVSG